RTIRSNKRKILVKFLCSGWCLNNPSCGCVEPNMRTLQPPMNLGRATVNFYQKMRLHHAALPPQTAGRLVPEERSELVLNVSSYECSSAIAMRHHFVHARAAFTSKHRLRVELSKSSRRD